MTSDLTTDHVSDPDTALRGGWPSALAAIVGIVTAYHRILRTTPFNAIDQTVEAEQFYEPASTPPLWVIAVAAWMIWRRRDALRWAMARWESPLAAIWGGLGWTIAGALLLWSIATSALDLGLASLAIGLMASGFWLGGRPGARLLALPACVLCLGISPPGVALNAALFELQMWTTDVSAAVLHALGFEARVSLDLIASGPRLFRVIESCAGLRSIEALLLASIVLGEALDATLLRRWVLVLLAPPVAFALNAARVVSIIALEQETSHLAQGLIAIVLGVCVLATVDAGLSRFSRADDAARFEAPRVWPSRTLYSIAAIGVVLGILGAIVESRWAEPEGPLPRLLLPTHYAGWDATGRSVDTGFMGSAKPTVSTHMTLVRDGANAHLFVGLDTRRNRNSSVLSEKTLYFESGAQVDRHETILDADRGPIDRMTYYSVKDRAFHRVHHWHVGFASLIGEIGRSLAALDRLPGHRSKPAFVVRISKPLGAVRPSPDATADADRELDAIGRELQAAVRATLD